MNLLRTTVFVMSFGSGLLISMTEATNKRAVFVPRVKTERSTTSTTKAPLTTTPAISDGDAGQCPWGQLLQRNGTVCCWVISCSPGYSIENCVMSGGNDTCQKCNKGHLQPRNVTSFNMDEATCFEKLKNEHTDCDGGTVKTKSKSAEVWFQRGCPLSCECDTSLCNTGETPCACTKVAPCMPHHTLNKTSGKCEPCPRFFYKLETGCFSCTLNITAFSMGNEYKPVTMSVEPEKDNNIDSGESLNNSTSVINDGVINPAGEKQDSNSLMSNVAIVLACLSVLIVSAVLFILLKRKKLTRCQPKVGLCCTSYHSVARDGIEMDEQSTCSNTDTKLLNTTETNRLLTTSVVHIEQLGRTDRINGHIGNGHIANGRIANGGNGHTANGHIGNGNVGQNRQNGKNKKVQTYTTNGVKEYKEKTEAVQGASGGASYQGHGREEGDLYDDSETDSKCDADSIGEIGAGDIMDDSRSNKRYYLEGDTLGFQNCTAKGMLENKKGQRFVHKGNNGRKKCDKNGGDVVIDSERFEDRSIHIGSGPNANDNATSSSMFMNPAILNPGNMCQVCHKNKICDNSVRPKTIFKGNTFNNCNINFCGCSAGSSSKNGVAEDNTRLLDDTRSRSSNMGGLSYKVNNFPVNPEIPGIRADSDNERVDIDTFESSMVQSSTDSNNGKKGETFNSENKNMSTSQPSAISNQSFIRVHEIQSQHCPSGETKSEMERRSESDKSSRAESGFEKNGDSFKNKCKSIENDKLNSVKANTNKNEGMKENEKEGSYKTEHNSDGSEYRSEGNSLNNSLGVQCLPFTANVAPMSRLGAMPISPNTSTVQSLEVRPSFNQSVSQQERPTARVPPFQPFEPQSHHVSHLSGVPSGRQSLSDANPSYDSMSYAILHHNPTYSNGNMDIANQRDFESIHCVPPVMCRRELPNGREQPDGCSMSRVTGDGFVSDFDETDPKTYVTLENDSNIDSPGIDNTQPKVINNNFAVEAIVNNNHSVATESSFELYNSVNLDSEFSEDVDKKERSEEEIHTTDLSGEASVEFSIVALSSHVEYKSEETVKGQGHILKSVELSVRDLKSNVQPVNKENAKERQDLESVELSQVNLNSQLNSHVDSESEDRHDTESDGSVELSGVVLESSLESGGE